MRYFFAVLAAPCCELLSLLEAPRAAVACWTVGLATALLPVQADATPYWIRFVDKGLSAGAVGPALVARAAELSPRALARRQRTRCDRGLDERDLPVDAFYLASVLAHGGRLRAVSRWLNAVSVEADATQVEVIRGLPFVTAVIPVSRRAPLPEITAMDEGPLKADYGLAAAQLRMLGVPALHECGLTGRGVVIGVLDTGFDLSHVAFSHLDVLAAHDFVNHDEIVSDQAGDPPGQDAHGTKVLALIAGQEEGRFSGAAPDATVILAKVDYLTTDEPIEDDWWVAGLEWIESLGADMATNSLGFCSSCSPERMDGQTEATSIAATTAIANGLVLLSSAGNGGPQAMTINAPADADGIIAIGSVQASGVVAVDSSRGPTWDGRTKPELCAPGVGVYSVRPSSLDQYESSSGTSFATPLAAGVVALLLQAYPHSTPTEMRQRLISTASAASAPTQECGWGILSAGDAVGAYCSCPDADQDGYRAEECGGSDCNDQAPLQHPDAPEICANGVDDDCDGAQDEQDCVGGPSASPRPAGSITGRCTATSSIALAPLLMLLAAMRRNPRVNRSSRPRAQTSRRQHLVHRRR